LADVMGIEGAGHGYPEARALAGAIALERDN